MKHLREILGSLLLICGFIQPVQATVLVDNTWADGVRNIQNPPTESAWFTTSAANMVAFPHLLSVTNTTTSSGWYTYFTASGSPASLNVGDTLTITLDFTPVGVGAQNSSKNLRFGLYNSAAGTRATGDGSIPNGSYIGYGLFSNFGLTWGSGLQAVKRTAFSSNDPLSSSGDSTVIGSTSITSGTIAFSNNVPYTLVISVQRTDASTNIITATYSGGGLNASVTGVDSSGLYTTFDMLEIRPSGSATTANNFQFTEMRAEVVSAAAPPTINSSPASQSLLVGQDATFSVDASGGSLTYQWYYNTNTVVTDATNATLTLTDIQLTDAGTYSVIVSNAIGAAPSDFAVLMVSEPVGPGILTQPLSQTNSPGGSVTFEVIASGSEPLNYQWYYNTNTLITNATDATLTLNNVQASDAGTYSVVVSNFVSSIASSFAMLTINTNPVRPMIVSQPLSQVVLVGSSPSLTVTASGTAQIFYQWSKGSVPIPGATLPTLTFANVQPSDAGSYTVTASNSVGTATSDAATLAVANQVVVPDTAFNLVGFGQHATGGGLLADTDPNYAKVFTATDFANAILSKTVKVIEIMNDLNLGYNEIPAAAKAGSEPFRADTTPALHPVLLTTGVSVIDIQKKAGLTIFSANGATLRHGHINLKNSSNVIIRNLKFDELWEWDEVSKGNYDKNNWDFITVGDAGAVTDLWIDHCTFTKAYDGLVDIKKGSSGITLSWCKYTGDDGATNTNSWVRQQINSLEATRASHTFYNFLRNNGFSAENIITIIQGHDKTHLIGANDKDPLNALHTVTLHHEWFINPWDRLPRLRGGNVHDFNIYVDDTAGLAAQRLRNNIANAMTTANRNTLNNTYSFKPFLNGSISTENGAMLVEKSVYIDCATPLRNNQTDPSDPTYTGKIEALDTIYQMDDTVVRGNSTDAGNPLGPFQAPIIPFSWNLPNNQLPYSYTMDDPSQLQAIITDPVRGAGAGVLNWAKTNWLVTAYAPTLPVIAANPQNQTLAAGETATFIVVAGGSAPLTYQWFYNTNTPLPNATNATFTVANIAATNAGTYSVIVSNSAGAVPSFAASLMVTSVPAGFSTWANGEFTGDQLNNATISGPGATPAGDGVPNLIKYALGLHAFVAVSKPSLTVGSYVNGDLVLTYHRPAGITDVTYDVQVSIDLTTWSDAGVSQQNVGTDENGLQIWQARFTGSTSNTRYLLLRIVP